MLRLVSWTASHTLVRPVSTWNFREAYSMASRMASSRNDIALDRLSYRSTPTLSIWHHRLRQLHMNLLTDLKFAVRSLARVKGLAATVIVTLALGIGANAAIFSVVRGVLLRPLVNRDAERLIYIRQ